MDWLCTVAIEGNLLGESNRQLEPDTGHYKNGTESIAVQKAQQNFQE
jgi:hypothetical protein